ncbi:Oligoxyloglucan reducing end-specific cellobiohydrolase [Gigaspora margarita]|uniref:Oligoxyloglucan reducing end-specific cellobiohydrolase n=1 Tax=Gigaspora margarita TaxID=4874 RepID=A0A8H3X364_GIGMA|nr:Oligoxyloglucan reducing end-specific cellobiohydrolase [Gigaspora margarita]
MSFRVLCIFLLIYWLSVTGIVDSGEVTFSRRPLSSLPSRFFYFKKSQNILFLDVSGNVYRSSRFNRSDEEQIDWIRVNVPENQATSLIPHPFDNEKAYILTKGTTHYKTDDYGLSWKSFNTPYPPSKTGEVLAFNAKKSGSILFRVTNCDKECIDEVYYTDEGFNNEPKLLLKNIGKCLWGFSTNQFSGAPDDSIFCIQLDSSNNNKLIESENFFSNITIIKSKLDNKEITGVMGLAAVNKYLVAVTSNIDNSQLELFVTTDGNEWKQAQFPYESRMSEEETSFTILESSVNNLVVDVLSTGSAHSGTLFSSSSDGSYFINRLNHTNRNDYGFVDFEKDQSVEGILLANIVHNWKNVDDKNTKKELRSKISFDDGVTWNYIQPPQKNLNNKKFNCDINKWKTGDCSLHLHSVTTAKYYGFIYSSPSTAGFLMGVGNVGSYLLDYDECSTFLSTDGGITWNVVAHGPHQYEFGDMGSVIVMIDDKNPIDYILYSSDFGRTWQKFVFGITIKTKLLTSDPESLFREFIIIGEVTADHSNNIKAYSFRIDFSKLYDRQCMAEDFEIWAAKKIDGVQKCLMGHTTKYKRRKANVKCYIGGAHEHPHGKVEENCDCTDEDFECDQNFIFDPDTKKCIPNGPENVPPGNCKQDGDTYEGSSGYRLIPGNRCKENDNTAWKLKPVIRKCTEDQLPFGEISHSTLEIEFQDFFYFKDSKVILATTPYGEVFRSDDEGTKWKNLANEELADAGEIIFIFMHDQSNEKAYLFSKSHLWYTGNQGASFEKMDFPRKDNLPLLPNNLGLPLIDFHPTEFNWLLYMGGTPCPRCHTEVHFSRDNGKTWEKMIETWAEKCIFARDKNFEERNKKDIFCSSYKDKNYVKEQDELQGRPTDANPLQLVLIEDFENEKREVLFTNVVEFYVFDVYMAVATEYRGQLFLSTSMNGKDFSEVSFPPNIDVDKKAYTILQSTTGSVFLDVVNSSQSGEEYGSLFKSDSTGVRYSLILDDTNRNNVGNVDFEKVQGMVDGIILANVVNNTQELIEGTKKKVISKISFDDGSTWERLKIENCQGENCYLNLHSRTAIHRPGGVFSSSSAIGLLMGVGNVGPYLKPYTDSDTFMSRDVGRTWSKIRNGESLYAFGDQGSIMVVVDDEFPTNSLLYSLNYGNSWNRYQFSDSPVRITHLITASNQSTMKFLIRGFIGPENQNNAKWILITVDFSSLLPRKCKKIDSDTITSDFEEFDPMANSNNVCFLGEKVTYLRRKIDRKCKIDDDLRKYATNKTCSCSEYDFECDVDYWREDGKCKLFGYDHQRPANCTGQYLTKSGYRKISKSKCVINKEGKDLTKEILKNCNDTDNVEIITRMHSFESQITDYFYFNDTNTILIRANNQVWKSTDQGYNWTTIEELDNVLAMFQNPYSNEYAYFVKLSDTLYYTTDSATTIQTMSLKLKPNALGIPVLDFHPKHPHWLIYTASKGCESIFSTDCHSVVYYTTSHGERWTELDTYSRICSWARDTKVSASEDIIFCESYLEKTGSQKSFYNNSLQFWSTRDFGANKKILFNNIVGFVTFENFIVVAELSPNQKLQLWVSMNGEKFAKTHYPKNMEVQDAFTILESTTGSIILHATTSSPIGGSVKKLQSRITFNDGGTWQTLTPPKRDSEDKRYDCNGCTLHLHSYTERRDPRDAFSSSSVKGIMIGVGNVGDYLSPYLDGNTFMTRDAGVTWTEVKKGAYMYEFGGLGSILILVDDEAPTNQILYSFDEGKTWQEHLFTKRPIKVHDITTHPSGIKSEFLLRGRYQGNFDNELVVYLNFTPKLPNKCNDDDFELWAPTHPGHPGHPEECLFGHVTKYYRRNFKRNCYIGEEFSHPIDIVENCKCDEYDFECDFNYVRAKNNSCVLVPNTSPLKLTIQEMCANGAKVWYNGSKGYRKIPISTCSGGEEYFLGESHICPTGSNSASKWIILILVLIVLGAIVAFCMFRRRNRYSYLSQGRIRLGDPMADSQSFLSNILESFMDIVSQIISKIPLPGSGNGYRYRPVSQDDHQEVLLNDYDDDNQEL